jgi:hypothetical protein
LISCVALIFWFVAVVRQSVDPTFARSRIVNATRHDNHVKTIDIDNNNDDGRGNNNVNELIYIGHYLKNNPQELAARSQTVAKLLSRKKAIVTLATQREYLIGAYGLGASLR